MADMKDTLSLTFSALADPTRRGILSLLAEGEKTVTELVASFELSQPAISKHLKVLEKAGLIERGREAQWRPARLLAEPLKEAFEWLEQYRQYWERDLDRPETRADVVPGDGREAQKESIGERARPPARKPPEWRMF